MAEIAMGDLPRYHRDRKPSGAPAFTHPEGVVSWAQFEDRANRRARLLRDAGVKAGDFVTLAIANGNSFYENTFAIWKLGATPNPVASKLPAGEFRAIVDLVKPSVVVGADPTSLPGVKIVPAEADLQGYDFAAVSEPPAKNWKGMTSGGSTGRPKVIVDHRPAQWDPAAPGFGQRVDGVVLNPGPLYHNAPFGLTATALHTGAHVVLMVRFDAEETLRLVEQHRATWLYLVPTMMSRIWRMPGREKFDLSSLHTMWHMAAPCPPWLKEEWINWIGGEKFSSSMAAPKDRRSPSSTAMSGWRTRVRSASRWPWAR